MTELGGLDNPVRLATPGGLGYHSRSKGGDAMRACVVFFFIVVSLVSLPLAADGIQWAVNQPLRWADFRGAPPSQPMLEAASIDMRVTWHVAYTVSYDPSRSCWTGRIDGVTVENTMDPYGSWVVPGKENRGLLNHEQRHFDLNEVYALRLRAELCRVSATGKTAEAAKHALSERINGTAAQILSTLSAMQELYDDETGHGTDPSAQAEWDIRIDSWLARPELAPATVGGLAVDFGKMVIQSKKR